MLSILYSKNTKPTYFAPKYVDKLFRGNAVKFIEFESKEGYLDDKVISDLIHFINMFKNKTNLLLNFKEKKLYDKMSIMMLEYICYDLIMNNKNVVLQFSFERNIATEEFEESPLLYLGFGKNYNVEMFKKQYNFSSNLSDAKNTIHYRICISENGQTDYLQDIYSDAYKFMPNYVLPSIRKTIADLVIELVGNANEHTKADCLLDIDITANNYENKKKNNNKTYYGVNISIMNISEKLFFDDVKIKIKESEGKIEGRNKERYRYVFNSYKKQEPFFNSKYSENDFWILSALQHKISGDINKNDIGGVGMTSLISTLQEASEVDNCYLHTGNEVCTFRKRFLAETTDKWQGFNDTRDLISPPDKSIFSKSNLYIPGTGYNLNFIIENKENSYE